MRRDYDGFQEICVNAQQLPEFYAQMDTNPCELLPNEYLLLRNEEGELIDQFRWDGSAMNPVKQKTIKGKSRDSSVRPRNPQQLLALDLLYNSAIPVKLLTGCFGSGKDYLMLSAAMDMLERGKYDRLVYVRNNVEVKDSRPIGHLPGDGNDKLLPYAMPLADHLGGVAALEIAVRERKIEIVHLGFLRGRDIRDAIIYVSEGENLTKEHVQLLLGRVGEGSTLWINGDYKQVDAKVFAENNGIMRMIQKLQGNPLFGYVKLLKTERSPTAALADLLD